MGEGGWERKSSRPWPPAGWPGASAEAWAATAADLNELRAWASNEDMARRGDWNRLVDCFLVARETCLVRQGNTCTQSGAKRRKAAQSGKA